LSRQVADHQSDVIDDVLLCGNDSSRRKGNKIFNEENQLQRRRGRRNFVLYFKADASGFTVRRFENLRNGRQECLRYAGAMPAR
jgi:hypothetical protein